jgi:hypothetical protein
VVIAGRAGGSEKLNLPAGRQELKMGVIR